MRITLALIAALGLAACSGSSTTGSTDGAKAAPAATTPDASAAATPPAAPAAMAAIDGPATGKWKTTVMVNGRAMPSAEVCVDKLVDFSEAQKLQQQAGTTCSEVTQHREGDVLTVHSACTLAGGRKTVSDIKVTGDFKSSYTTEMHTVSDPPVVPGKPASDITVKSERVGDCDAK